MIYFDWFITSLRYIVYWITDLIQFFFYIVNERTVKIHCEFVVYLIENQTKWHEMQQMTWLICATRETWNILIYLIDSWFVKLLSIGDRYAYIGNEFSKTYVSWRKTIFEPPFIWQEKDINQSIPEPVSNEMILPTTTTQFEFLTWNETKKISDNRNVHFDFKRIEGNYGEQ